MVQMKCSFLSIVILSLTAAALAGMTFDDIEMWVGEGSNQAALVIDWNDGESELVKVWGFRWDGTATGADMLLAVCQADASLYVMAANVPGEGVAFGGFGYDSDADGVFNIVKSGSTSSFDTNGYMAVASDIYFDGWIAEDSGDNWAGGWFDDGFWGYYGTQGGAWDWPGVGAVGRTLTNGSWDGWSWNAAPDWWGGDPSVVVAVPEPATLALLGAGLCFVRKRK
jgi:hypothetical protein